mmetsp:Transcript_26818/g.43173  ORF Transcript_26818/g.43173 Transcript_26818/m.43173 type:complete len:319 (+) Transcript_26818:96-1052(+)
MVLHTPLVSSRGLRKLLGVKNVWLKLENLQASGSFKDRGLLNLCSALKENGCKEIVCSSGGNAGLAAAHSANVLGMEAVIVTPKSTNEFMRKKIEEFGAKVIVHGDNWNQADALARRMVAENNNAEYVPPFDHELIWKGHSSMVDEIKQDSEPGFQPDVVAVSVGGGGLLSGVLQGLKRNGWEKTRVLAAETHGAASMHQALARGKPHRLEEIATVATTLGALQVSDDAFNFAREHPGGVQSILVSDREAVQACSWMAENHRFLVEPSCGAAIAATQKYFAEMPGTVDKSDMQVVIVICGGSGISPELLSHYEKVTSP